MERGFNEILQPGDMCGVIMDSICRYVLGHLVTAFELYEEKRVRDQCQNLLQVARRLLGKIGKCCVDLKC